MEMILKREVFTEKSTIGSLYVNGVFECFILEDKDRGIHSSMPLAQIEKMKVYGETAIPYGKYKVIYNRSEAFSKKKGHEVKLPLLMDVPAWKGVRIHTGNKPEHSLGCLLTGGKKSVDFVSNSTIEYEQLEPKIISAQNRGELITIEIVKA
jgi:hypothetical protein